VKFTVETIDFKNALTKVMKVASPKSIVPIIENVEVEIKQNKCYLKATNLSQYIKTKIDIVDTDEDGIFVFTDTKSLLKSMKFYNEFLISFEISGGNKVKIACGNKSAIQRIYNSEDTLPEFPELNTDESTEYKYNSLKLKERFNLIKYAVSKSGERPIFAGIHFNGEDMVALDGFRMALNKDSVLDVTTPFTLPCEAFNAVDGILNGDITIVANHKYLTMSDKNTTYMSRLLDGEYLKYKEVIPHDGVTVEVGIKGFNESLKYFKTFDKKEVKAIPTVLNNNVLTFRNSTGEYESKVDIENGFDFKIGFIMDYMIEGLSQFKSDKINIKARSPLSPMVLSDNTENFAVVLPFRIPA